MPTNQKTPRRENLVGLIVRDFPADLKDRIHAAVDEEGTNRNDVLVGELADWFGVKFHPSGKRAPTGDSSTTVVLYMPQRLRHKINGVAYRERTSARRVVLDILLDRFPE